MKEVVQAQGQEASRAPDQARQQRPERRRQRPEAGERHPPHQAGEGQHQDAVPQPDAGGERQQPHAAQRQAQAARRRRRRLPAQPRPPLPRREVAQVAAGGQRQQPPGARGASARAPLRARQEAGEEEEGTGDAEERAEAERAGAQQRPQPGRRGHPALGPRAQQRGQDKGGQGAEREACPGAERGRRRLHVAEAAEVDEEAARRVLPQRAHAALHVAVAQALGGRGGRGRRRRRRGPHGWRVPLALVLPHGCGRGWPLALADPAPSAFRAPRASQSAQGCARRRRRPGSPARGLRGGGVRLMLAGGEGREGLLCVPGRRGRLFFFPPQTPLGTGDGGVASTLPRAAAVTSRLQLGPLGARSGAPPPRLPLPGARPACGPARSRDSAGRHSGGSRPRQDAHPGPRG